MDTPLFDGELVHARRMIYTPSAFAKSNLVHLQEVGQLQARSPHASTRQGLASYLFFVVESGSGTLEYEGETRVLSAGDCVFLDCRRPYRHYTGDDLWQLRWAHFYGPNMAAIYKKYRERGGQPSFHPENTAPYTRRLEALYTLAASDNYVRDMQICEGLFALLTLLMQESWHPEVVRTAGTKRQNVQEIKDYLDLHFAEKITLDALAEFQRAGKIRYIGVSNETAFGVMRYLHLADKHDLPRIATIQNPYSLLNRSFEVGLAEVSQYEGVELLAYSCLGFGTLTGKYLNGAKPAGARNTLFSRFTRYSGEQTQKAVAAYVDIAKRHNLDPAQMALAFVRRQPFVASTLLGATTMEQLKTNVESLHLELSEEVLAEIEAVHQVYTYPAP